MAIIRVITELTKEKIFDEKIINSAERLGKYLAKRNHALVTDIGFQIPDIVANVYRGKEGERSVIPYFDSLMYMLNKPQGIIAITGNESTLKSLETAINQFSLPASYLQASSSFMDSNINKFTETCEGFRTVENLVRYIESKL